MFHHTSFMALGKAVAGYVVTTFEHSDFKSGFGQLPCHDRPRESRSDDGEHIYSAFIRRV